MDIQPNVSHRINSIDGSICIGVHVHVHGGHSHLQQIQSDWYTDY